MTDIDKSISFIKEFASIYLNDNLDNLLDFPLDKVRLDKTFGPVNRKYDADDGGAIFKEMPLCRLCGGLLSKSKAFCRSPNIDCCTRLRTLEAL